MLGAICGDIIGSVYEVRSIKTTDFPLFSESSTFTDDTVLTIAIADSIRNNIPYAVNLKKYYKRYPFAGYGGSFRNWAASGSMEAYNSWGNGSAMRVSPVGFAFEDLHEVLAEAERSAAVTHNHPEGIKGARAVAAAIFLARKGSDKDEIKQFIEDRFSYDLNEPLDVIREYYRFDVSCQGSVPQSIISFLEADDVEDAIRKAISLGGDSDTMACIAGGIAHAFYKKIPDQIAQTVLNMLDDELRTTVTDFMKAYTVTY